MTRIATARSLFVFANRDDNAKIISTDDGAYGGSNVGNLGGLATEAVEWQGGRIRLSSACHNWAVVAFKRETLDPAEGAGNEPAREAPSK